MKHLLWSIIFHDSERTWSVLELTSFITYSHQDYEPRFFLAQGIWPGGIIHINKNILFRQNLCNDNSNCKADHKDHRCVDFTVHPKPKKRENIHNNIKKKDYWSTCSFCQGSWWSPHHSRPVSASGCAERFPPLQSLESLKSLDD